VRRDTIGSTISLAIQYTSKIVLLDFCLSVLGKKRADKLALEAPICLKIV
jgi:hypothetical protein